MSPETSPNGQVTYIISTALLHGNSGLAKSSFLSQRLSPYDHSTTSREFSCRTNVAGPFCKVTTSTEYYETALLLKTEQCNSALASHSEVTSEESRELRGGKTRTGESRECQPAMRSATVSRHEDLVDPSTREDERNTADVARKTDNGLLLMSLGDHGCDMSRLLVNRDLSDTAPDSDGRRVPMAMLITLSNGIGADWDHTAVVNPRDKSEKGSKGGGSKGGKKKDENNGDDEPGDAQGPPPPESQSSTMSEQISSQTVGTVIPTQVDVTTAEQVCMLHIVRGPRS